MSDSSDQNVYYDMQRAAMYLRRAALKAGLSDPSNAVSVSVHPALFRSLHRDMPQQWVRIDQLEDAQGYGINVQGVMVREQRP